MTERVRVDYCSHTIPEWAVEEKCQACHQRATHKIEETSGTSAFHPLTAYLCCGCFMHVVTYDCATYPYDVQPVTSLYDVARKVTDEVMGEGTYAEINAGNSDPRVQRAIEKAIEEET